MNLLNSDELRIVISFLSLEDKINLCISSKLFIPFIKKREIALCSIEKIIHNHFSIVMKHGSELILELKKYDKSAQFRFWGGDQMKSAGGKLIKHYKKISFMGFWEVFINLPKIINNLAFCKSNILIYPKR